MPLTPLDILQKKFTAARRGGYEPEEVEQFLEEVRESWEETLKALAHSREVLRARDDQLTAMREEQSEIKDTLVLARRLSNDLEGSARREAEVIVGEARLASERILMATREEERTLQDVVVRLKAARLHHIAQMRALVESHGKLLEAYDGVD